MKNFKFNSVVFYMIICVSVCTYLIGCEEKDAENEFPSCEIISPENGSEIDRGQIMTIFVSADDPDGYITEVNFIIDEVEVHCTDSLPYSYAWNTNNVDLGDHMVEVNVTDNNGAAFSDNVIVTIIGSAPVANFSLSRNHVYSDSSVKFIDYSSKIPTSWFWDFGDGETSTDQNPIHAYGVEGIYSVTLTVTNDFGSDTKILSNCITIIPSSVTDYDGNKYKTVLIGGQLWMKENLKTSRLNDGTTIPLVDDPNIWYNLSTPGYCWYLDDSARFASDYGALYNFHTVNSEKLCPDGWHVPDDDDWKLLSNYLGGANIAGKKMKEAGNEHWSSGADFYSSNESKFTALPGGSYGLYGYNGYRHEAYWWSSTFEDYNGHCRFVTDNSTYLYENDNSSKESGLSVRCLKD